MDGRVEGEGVEGEGEGGDGDVGEDEKDGGDDGVGAGADLQSSLMKPARHEFSDCGSYIAAEIAYPLSSPCGSKHNPRVVALIQDCKPVESWLFSQSFILLPSV